MGSLIRVESLVLELLLVVSVVAIVVRRLRIHYTVALVLVGLALSLRSPLELQVTPELILFLFIPPLVFEAAFQIDWKKLRRNLGTIFLFAVPGVVLTTVVTGGIVTWGAKLPSAVALVFGALVGATDPVSVVAIFRKLGAPKRLEVLMEAESLFNDGTAIVIFSLTLAAVQIGKLDIVGAVFEFLRVAGGGVIVGVALGWLTTRLIGHIDDYLVETTLTTVLAFGSYLFAEQFHLSGVLAVVCAGLVSGNLSRSEMSPTTRIVVHNFWEYVAFLANSAVFLMIGLEMDIGGMLQTLGPTLWGLLAVLVSRGLNVYLLSRLGRPIPERWRHVLFWGGLRGAITLALALSLPEALGPERSTVIVMTFGVVLFTMVGQGMSLEWLVDRLQLVDRTEEQIEYERRHARAIAARAGLQHLSRLHDDGLISSHIWEKVRPRVQHRIDALTVGVQEALAGTPELENEELIISRREMLRAQRSTLNSLRRTGAISQSSYEDLIVEVDAALESDFGTWTDLAEPGGGAGGVDKLIMVVLQSRDLESAVNALAMRGIRSTQVQSRGGFLRRANHLVLVGIPEGRLPEVVETLERTARSRVEYLSMIPEGVPVPLPDPISVQVKGATVFVFDVERYEAI
jgi:CPA1 family monovalent cation:H+ antiporter